MSNNCSATNVSKSVNGMPEQKLKQARLPFKLTTVKRSITSEGSKKRKHEDDTENAPQPAYIDITEEKERSQSPLNIDNGVKSNKVCIIQAESKPENSSSKISDEPKISDSKPNEKCSLQKWFKPKKVEVTSNITNIEEKADEKCDEVEASNLANEKTEPMEVDDSAHSQQPDDTQKGAEEDNVSLVDDSINDSVNLSTDVEVSENDRSFNKTESSTPSTPSSKSNLKKKLTPRQKSKREEIELKRQEKERLKKEKEKKRLEEKEEKQRLKEEKEKKRLAEIEAKNEEKRQKEEERKAKEEEKKKQKEEERKLKEEERKQKEEERKQKEEERKQKEEERKQKEEERKQKEEERKQKEEQKKQKEEQERKLKEKTAAAFTNFFLPKTKETPKEPSEHTVKANPTMFMPFEVKENMRLASIHRVNVSRESLQSLDVILQKDEALPKESLYLAVLKSKTYKPGRCENTWPLNTAEEDDDVMIVDDEHSLPATEKPMQYRCKLIQFRENRRPAYWGTWRKRSKKVSGRAPFKQDEIFDYEVDSDEEWEDEPGEDLEGGSEDEKESEDDYEVDNDVFVPHGYLSDEEGQNDDCLDSSPKSNKLKLNVLERQFEEEMKEKTHKLKPRIFGCIWIENIVKSNEGATNVENLLLAFRAVFNEKKTPFCVPSESNEVTPHNTPSVKAKLKNEFPDSLLPDLIKLAHGSKKNTKILAKEFNAYVLNKDPTLNLTLSCITNKLKEISTWISNLSCRLVNDEIKNQCGLNDLSHTENTWKYITVVDKPVPEKMLKLDPIEKPQVSVNAAASPSSSLAIKENPKIKSSITKFVKVLTAEEKQMAFNEIASEKTDKQTVFTQNPKPKPKKNDITKFIKFGASIGKSADSEFLKNTAPQNTVSIDLTEDNSNPLKDPADQSVCEAARPDDHRDSKIVSQNTLDLANKSENIPVIGNPTSNSASISKTTPNKPTNILIPRKVPQSPTVNVLIPRKTPSRPIASANAEMPPPKTFNFHDIKSQTTTYTPKRLLESLNQTDPPKPINFLVPRRANDVDTSKNSKPVNVLIPRRASDMKNMNNKTDGNASSSKSANNTNKTDANVSSSKPVNILIPRRAKDVKQNDVNVLTEGMKAPKPEKAKDFAQDDASTDFSLSIESNDAPEQAVPTESDMEVEN